MKEYSSYYVGRRDEESGEVPYAVLEALGGQLEWFTVDGGQLIMPVRLHERNGNSLSDPPIVILKQYGGDRLARQLLAEGVEGGDVFNLEENELGDFEIETEGYE